VMPDLLGGRLTMVFASPASALPLAREGKVRPLAVTSLFAAAIAAEAPLWAKVIKASGAKLVD
jgi:tripartite-type tricarboxylate transporter receptor subunit TctC